MSEDVTEEPLKPKLNATNLHVLAEAIAVYEAVKGYAESVSLRNARITRVEWDVGGAVHGHSAATALVARQVQNNLRAMVDEAVRMAKRDVIAKGYEAGIRIQEEAL